MSVASLVEPIRIFVGCDDSMMVPAHVLEYSIRQHTDHHDCLLAFADILR